MENKKVGVYSLVAVLFFTGLSLHGMDEKKPKKEDENALKKLFKKCADCLKRGEDAAEDVKEIVEEGVETAGDLKELGEKAVDQAGDIAGGFKDLAEDTVGDLQEHGGDIIEGLAQKILEGSSDDEA